MTVLLIVYAINIYLFGGKDKKFFYNIQIICKKNAFIPLSQYVRERNKKHKRVRNYCVIFRPYIQAPGMQIAKKTSSPIPKYLSPRLEPKAGEVHDIADGRYDGRIQKFQQGVSR